MEMTPLALVVLLGYALLIVVCLTLWTTISYYRRPDRSAEIGEQPPRKPVADRPRERPVSNDEVRGAVARAARAGEATVQAGRRGDEGRRERGQRALVTDSGREYEDDAFERFLRARPDDVDLDR